MNPIAELAEWRSASGDEKRDLCARVASELDDVSFCALARFSAGHFSHQIGVFDHDGCRFLLIPGGTVTLGFDLRDSGFPTDALRDLWGATYQHKMNGNLRIAEVPPHSFHGEMFRPLTHSRQYAQVRSALSSQSRFTTGSS